VNVERLVNISVNDNIDERDNECGLLNKYEQSE
jgi:hypothetical protein